MKTSQRLSSNERKARADRVKMFMDELDIEGHLKKLRQQYLEEIAGSDPHESKKRESAYHAVHVVDHVREHIKTILISGQVAEIDLKRQ